VNIPERLRLDDARVTLQGLVSGEQGSTSDVAAALRAFERFASMQFQVPDLPDADGLLFQYGVFSFTGRPMFTLSLIRQFEQCDEQGDHESYRQVGVELLFEPDAALMSLGHKESWCFDGPGSPSAAEEWFAELRSASVFRAIDSMAISSLAVIDDFT
jgi:hypothetical protein